MALVTELGLSLDTHVVRATDQILEDVRRVSTEAYGKIYSYAGRVGNTRQSVYGHEAPYALLKIGPQSIDKMASELVIIKKTVEILLSLVFKVGTRDSDGEDVDIQAYGDALADLTWQFLSMQTVDNLNGAEIDRSTPRFWRYLTDTKFKNDLGRTVTKLIGTDNMDGSLYAVPLQFKIEIHATVPLT